MTPTFVLTLDSIYEHTSESYSPASYLWVEPQVPGDLDWMTIGLKYKLLMLMSTQPGQTHLQLLLALCEY